VLLPQKFFWTGPGNFRAPGIIGSYASLLEGVG
jgi:hypothetical protein